MLIKIEDKIYSTEDSRMAIIWADDEEKQVFTKVINDMPTSEGDRAFIIFDQNKFPGSQIEWSKIETQEDYDLLQRTRIKTK